MPGAKLETVQTVLNAFLGLFTQPFEQDLRASVTAAATAISLAGLEGLVLLANDGRRTALVIGGFSLALVLVWMAVTAVVTTVERRGLTIARNLSVVSFWIAVTLVFVLAVEFLFPGPFNRAIRFLSVSVVLLILVPVHMFRNLLIGSAFWMTVFLWLSTISLARMVIFGVSD